MNGAEVAELDQLQAEIAELRDAYGALTRSYQADMTRRFNQRYADQQYSTGLWLGFLIGFGGAGILFYLLRARREEEE